MFCQEGGIRPLYRALAPTVQPNHHADWLNNTVHQFSVVGVHQQLVFTSRSIVEARAVYAATSNLAIPISGRESDHRLWDFLQHHGPVVDDPALPFLSERIGLSQATVVGEAIELVLCRIRDVICHRRGVTDSGSTASDVSKAGAGVCQDFAHLSLALLRRAGVPTCYVSGYLHRYGEQELQTHAWAESFVPGVGWIGFDPTHGLWVDETYVTVAAGRSFADVPPNRGVYRGDGQETLQVVWPWVTSSSGPPSNRTPSVLSGPAEQRFPRLSGLRFEFRLGSNNSDSVRLRSAS